ncbi:hypothetical protein DL766_000572 [Monosporascus sp. MC13-8B]|uniref:Proteophosphoglycan ppg4 n=1 Tax=Monosporascus cannonballus TaxID=155416 RepID=A0ABY0GQH7_9PEZI|nr:hypothetical protein DL762_010382 [Monosporascus cannonballus]RYO99518.1 hypothetical protein DL763_001429 [Monosporascus cannonballus]RYP39116.1 hypothetical protein DL766_000572 [Monosporascus sp. MC13-8B]
MALDTRAEKDEPSCSSSSCSSAGEDGSSSGHLLYTSLEHFNASRKRRRRPSIILGALVVLFLASGSAVALAVALMLQDDASSPTSSATSPANTQAQTQARHISCLARDLVLFASLLALLYLALHVRGALRRNHHRRSWYISNGSEQGQGQEGRGCSGGRVMRSGPGGPPHTMRGDFLHAGALLVSRLAIGVWAAALATTAVLIARAGRGMEGDGDRRMLGAGVVGAAPVLELLVCIFAIPPFVIISATIERHRSPFATTGLSQASFLTCRISAFADDLAAAEGDAEVGMLSISRRASLIERQRRMNNSNSDGSEEPSATAVTLTSTEVFRQGAPGGGAAAAQGKKDSNGPGGPREITNDEKNPNTKIMANSSVKTSGRIPPPPKPLGPRSQAPPLSVPAQHSPPQPAYNPGGWRSEWNNVAEQVGVSRITIDTETSSHPSSPSSSYSSSPSTREKSGGGIIVPASTYVSSRYSSRYSKNSGSSALRPSVAQAPGNTRSAKSGPANAATGRTSAHPKEQAKQKRRPPPAPSTSIASSEKRTGLSTVRYAAKPEVAVRQPVKVVPAPGSSSSGVGSGDSKPAATVAYSPATMVDTDADTDPGGDVWGRTGKANERAKEGRTGEEQGKGGGAVDGPARSRPTAVSVLRRAQRAQKGEKAQKTEKMQARARVRSFWGMRRSGSEDDGVKPAKEGEEPGVEVRVPGAFVDEG